MKKLIIVSALAIAFLDLSCGNNQNSKTIQASGTIEAINIIVSSKTSGTVQKINFNEGAKVNEGDAVLVLEHEQLDIQLLQAIAAKDVAEAQLKLILKGAREEDILQAEQYLNQAKINLENAEKDKSRMENLFESNSITQKQFEDAVLKFQLMQSQYKTAQENYRKIKQLFRPEEIQQAKANLNKAIAGVELLKKNISDCYVKSPITGYLVQIFIEEGETAAPMSALYKVSNLDTVELLIYVSAQELAKIKLGQSVDVKIDAYADKIYPGKISFISQEAEFTPKNIQTKEERTKLVFAVKITVKNENYDLKAGMPADALIKI